MSNLPILDCFQPTLARMERVRYFPRQLLTADDMVADQEYFRQKMRRHNRFLHGWGTVCGLRVTAAPTQEAPWQIAIQPGYALGPYGDEIFVAEAVYLNLVQTGPGATFNPCEPELRQPAPQTGDRVFVAIKYAECEARPIQALAVGCACDDLPCEFSRIRDSFEVTCLTDLPASHTPGPSPALCGLIARKHLPALLPCPDDPWVVLARVRLPGSATTALEKNMINNVAVRHQLYSTALIQRQLIRCCCKEGADDEAPPARVTAVEPADGGSVTPGKSGVVTVAVTFDKALDPSTATVDAIKIVGLRAKTTVPDAVIVDPATFKYDEVARKLTVSGTFQASADLRYRVTVRGNGAKRIRDIDGLDIDGDGDGEPGGDFKSHFTVAGGKQK